MDCKRCNKTEYCEYKKSGTLCPYIGLGLDDDYINSLSTSSGDL